MLKKPKHSHMLLRKINFLFVLFQGRSVETSPSIKHPPASSVAKLAGKFNVQSSSTANKEVPLYKPTRKKPPCSLPLLVNKVEPGHNGEEKPAGNICLPPKNKVKSSPIIEKLQLNLMLTPPGRPPKSPGLKVMPSPLSSPTSVPDSPNRRSRSSESDMSPISFDQPPEEAPLRNFIKVRTRGSLNRRPPSRKFRKSQTEMGDEDSGVILQAKQNGGKSEESDEVFEQKTEKSPETLDQAGGEGTQITLDEKLSDIHPHTSEDIQEKGTDEAKVGEETLEEKMDKPSSVQSTDANQEQTGIADKDIDEHKTDESQATSQEPSPSTETVNEPTDEPEITVIVSELEAEHN